MAQVDDLSFNAAVAQAATMSSSTSSPELLDRIGCLLVASCCLEHSSELVEVPDQQLRVIEQALRALPPQVAFADADHLFWKWLAVSALAEHEGLTQAADLILRRLQDLYSRKRGASSREKVALCWARRGRAARTDGAYDLAEACYREARRTSRTRQSDAGYQADLGLAVLASIHGNLPAVEERCRALLQRAAAPSIYRLPAHQMLSITCRKRGAFVQAMFHTWKAFDLLDGLDTRRFELLVSLAEIAVEAGDLEAAEHGFETVVQLGATSRAISPALAGLARLASARMAKSLSRHDDCRASAARLIAGIDAHLSGHVAPNEETSLLLESARLANQLGRTELAFSYMSRARHLCETNGLHELQFRLDSGYCALANAEHVDVRARARNVSLATRPIVLRRLVSL